MNGRPTGLGLHLLGVLGVAGWLFLSVRSRAPDGLLPIYAAVTAWGWMVFLAGWIFVRRNPAPRLLWPILAWAAVFRLCGLLSAPVMEDDHYRFLWDGRQFAVSGNPYETTPASHFNDQALPERFGEILDQVNYPSVPTIYGPVCQAIFLIGYLAAPGSLWPLKCIFVLADLALLAMGLALASRLRPAEDKLASGTRILQACLILGWCPLLIFETSFNAHPEILGVALLMAGLWCRSQSRFLCCGILCALAVAAKVVALLLIPFLIVRSLRGWIAFGLMLVLLYLPFWAQGSLADWEGLIAFAREWEFNSSVYAILRSLAGSEAARGICGAVFGAIWVVTYAGWLRRTEPALRLQELPPGKLVFGVFLLLSATVNPWYLLWLAAFTALRPGMVELSAMALVSLSYATGLNLGNPSLTNFEHPSWVRPVEYGGVALIAAVCFTRRRLRWCNERTLGSGQLRGCGCKR